jgi:hypothetical protein
MLASLSLATLPGGFARVPSPRPAGLAERRHISLTRQSNRRTQRYESLLDESSSMSTLVGPAGFEPATKGL